MRRVKEAIGKHYSNLEFAIDSVRGLTSISNFWDDAIKINPHEMSGIRRTLTLEGELKENAVRNASESSGLRVERNGLPSRSARHPCSCFLLFLPVSSPCSYRLVLDTRIPSSRYTRRIRIHVPIKTLPALIALLLYVSFHFSFFFLQLRLVLHSRTTLTDTKLLPRGSRTLIPF
jgi:hypothetical protein